MLRRSIILACIAVVSLGTTARSQLHLSPPAERCQRSASLPTGSAGDWLRRAGAVTLPDPSDRILRYRAFHDVVFWEQSDRMYPPFVPNVADRTVWYDPGSGLISRHPVERALAPGAFASEVFAPTEQYFIQDTIAMRIPLGDSRAGIVHSLNPWDVLRRWTARESEVRVTELCVYRDLPRVVLTLGDERLYLTLSDATPIKLEREEAHYLFGQVRAEYLWTTWWGVRGGGRYPIASFLLYDGEVYHRFALSLGTAQLVARDSAPRFTLPSTFSAPPPGGAADPDTVRVSANTFLLVTPAYTHAVTLQRDTIFLLDATTSEARARADSGWVARLFPGKHPVVLVVTDLAWPHISGVRFWVARGASIVSHASSEPFLRRVIDRKWTRTPDALEQNRSSARFRFVGVRDSLRLGGGTIAVHAMHGQTTEGAVGAWLPGEGFFWAGDYIQNNQTSPYGRDVARTLRALGILPTKIGAQHMPLLDAADFFRRYPGR
jgi:hypothetical protein